MTHRSGIQPHMPVIPYLKYRGAGNTACDSFFCKEASETYNIQVAENFYFQQGLQDRIWKDMNEVSMRRFDRYRYSDANMILVQRILERLQKDSLDNLAQRYFYEPLGLSHITYNPLEKFPEEHIVPTENDRRWRRQQLRGYVHDETAALLGGVAGHAGLFANAEDLAILFQMLLNGGEYARQRYLQAETIDLFTDDSHGNHRGLGFDKRYRSNRTGRAYDMTPNAYGHTGFTGTCAWVDPDHDLVFVFLSNRVFPSVRNRKLFSQNIRTRLHQVVYDALDSYEGGWPELEI
jgi:CubicO group peptidase (beta-lactamase class C family)